MNSPFKIDLKKPRSEGCPTGDEFYHTADIVQTVKDNEIIYEVIDNKENIRAKIDANANKCGLKNIIAMYQQTGDASLFAQQPILNNFDATAITGETVDEIKAKLPEGLIGDQSVEDFLKNISAADLVAFFQAQEKSEVKENVKEE